MVVELQDIDQLCTLHKLKGLKQDGKTYTTQIMLGKMQSGEQLYTHRIVPQQLLHRQLLLYYPQSAGNARTKLLGTRNPGN